LIPGLESHYLVAVQTKLRLLKLLLFSCELALNTRRQILLCEVLTTYGSYRPLELVVRNLLGRHVVLECLLNTCCDAFIVRLLVELECEHVLERLDQLLY